MIEIDIMKHRCICSSDSIEIIDSYQIPNDDILAFLIQLKDEIGDRIIYNRDIQSWREEWTCYNILYDLNIYRNITKNVCLYDNISEKTESLYNKFYNYYIMNK